jgi:putative glutamine amidotransferase
LQEIHASLCRAVKYPFHFLGSRVKVNIRIREEEASVQVRPVIGIATQTMEAIPGQLPATWIMGQRYVRVLASLGAVPWVIPLLLEDEETLRAIYERLDGVFLTGGVDVDPACYQESRHPLCGKTDLPRDWTEARLVRWAMRDRKPVLGVCRGIQLINVAAGGTLYQDVQAQVPNAIKHDYFPTNGNYTRDQLVHKVRVAPGSRLGEILGGPEVDVNSMHHQAVKDLAPGLTATAFAPDGLIEGVEGTSGQYLMAVQWHPEELAETMTSMRRLFTSFLAAAAGSSSALPAGERGRG